MEEQQPSLKDLIRQYMEIAWRRKLCLIPFPIIFLIGAIYTFSLPPIYQSEGKLLVEDQNIPAELVRTTVTSYAAQQMQVIQQQIESTENVLQLVRKYNLYSNSDHAYPAQLAQRFRDNMSLDTINVDVLDPTAGRRRIVSIAFGISFTDESPEIAQQVAQELVELFLERNTTTRTQEATETTDFLRDEADLLQARVVVLEDKIAKFKSEHANSLPELLEYNLGVITSSEDKILRNELSIIDLTEQEQLLSIELRAMDPYTGGVQGSSAPGAAAGQFSTASVLAQKKAELSQLLTRYSESHPSIVALRHDIEVLKVEIVNENFKANSDSAENEEDNLSPVYLNLRYRVGSIERDIVGLEKENESLKTQVAEYERRVAETYVVEREYDELQREYAASSGRYEQLRDAQYDAEVGLSLEQKNQVESLRVIETPKIPRNPVGPDRMKYLIMSIGFAGAVCAGLALALEFFDERIRGSRGHGIVLGQEPLISVARIRTQEDRRRRKKFKKKLALMFCLIAILFLVSSILFVHFFVIDLTVFLG